MQKLKPIWIICALTLLAGCTCPAPPVPPQCPKLSPPVQAQYQLPAPNEPLTRIKQRWTTLSGAWSLTPQSGAALSTPAGQ